MRGIANVMTFSGYGLTLAPSAGASAAGAKPARVSRAAAPNKTWTWDSPRSAGWGPQEGNHLSGRPVPRYVPALHHRNKLARKYGTPGDVR